VLQKRWALKCHRTCSVYNVSSAVYDVGDTAQIINDRELGPSESCKMWVSLEFRYGTCGLFLSKASSTSPSADRDL
jgi:hypothetical protein